MNPIGQAWRGEAPLAVVFWVFYLLLPSTVGLLLALQRQVLGTVPDAVILVTLAGAAAYLFWAHIALWRCAKRSHVLIQAAVKVWVATVFFFVFAWVFLMPSHPGYTTRAKVQEGTYLSNPARTALGIACSENELRAGLSNEGLGLEAPSVYNSTYVQSITAEGVSETEGRVTIVMKEIPFSKSRLIEAGSTIVYTGTCAPGGMTWSVSGTVAKKYLPKT